MNNKKTTIYKLGFLFTLLIFMMTSCSVTKMRYSRGFNISFEGKGSKRDEISVNKKKKSIYHTEKNNTNTESITSESVASSEIVNGELSTPITTLSNSEKTATNNSVINIKYKKSNKRVNIINTKNDSKSSYVNTCETKSKEENAETNKSNEMNKSWIVAFLLCWFLGGLGFHRFYLGYTGIGIIQLLTIGGLGLWWLIDFIRILIGSLKPKNGEYDKN